MKTYYFVRHGASTADSGEMELHGVNAPATVEDIPLSDLGKAEAEKAGQFFKKIGGVQAIYSSPLARTHDTAKIIASHLGLEVRVMPEVKEIDLSGILEFFKGGASKSPVKINPKDLPFPLFRSVMQTTASFFFFIWLFGNLPGNETPEEVSARLDEALLQLEAAPEERILVASHGYFISYIGQRLVKQNPGDLLLMRNGIFVPNCSATKISAVNGGLRMSYFARPTT